MRLALPALLLPLVLAGSAAAHHRQTPPVVAITTGGDADLPRLASPSRRSVAVTVDGTLAVITPFRGAAAEYTFTSGANDNASLNRNGLTVAWDSDADLLQTGDPGHQIFRDSPFGLEQVVRDPTGTSVNPALDSSGASVTFESTANFAGMNPSGARQIFLVGPNDVVSQISQGLGASRYPTMSMRGLLVTFESTSDPVSGADNGVPQVWVSNLMAGTSGPITHGSLPSERPTLSNDGRLVVFQSRDDLAGDHHHPGVSQIYAYDTRTTTYARITDDAADCQEPTAVYIEGDWRITYLCANTAFFTFLRQETRFRVQTDGGETIRIMAPNYAHFVYVVTTANLLGSGTTTGHRVYLVNLYKRTPESVASNVTWFPFRGIPPR